MTEIIPFSGDRVRELRTSSAMTEQELAERVGSPVDTIREIERNDREPSLDMLFRLAAALGVTPSDLLVGGERPLISADEPRTALAISGSVLR